jgi:glycosyltransferase involved in cell wall biosynthesis
MEPLLKADLHVHSQYSSRPSQWLLQKIGCPESFSSPHAIYERARERGMDLVTITDHNSIAGCLEIAHLPHTFISEEITTYFPDDKCKLHILAYDITEEDHREFQKVRPNVFDLVAYLRARSIVHALAHPLFAVNERLSVQHVEQCLILFNLFELNGSRDQTQNQTLRTILSGLTKDGFYDLVQKHALPPWGDTPWIKGLTAGSDDHSGLNIASMYTSAENVTDVHSYLQKVVEKKGQTEGVPAMPESMARNLYSIAYQFYHDRFNMKHARKSVFLRFVHGCLTPEGNSKTSLMERVHRLFASPKTRITARLLDSETVQEYLLREASGIIMNDKQFMAVAEGHPRDQKDLDRIWATFVNRASDRMIARFLERILQSFHKADLFDVFHSIGAAGSLYTMLAPYFVAYGLFSREQTFARGCLEQFGSPAKTDSACAVAHFTDTFEDVNGVAWTIKRQLTAAARHTKSLHVLTCGPEVKAEAEADQEGVYHFVPVSTFNLPEYPDQSVHCPPFLDLLTHCFRHKYSMLLAATPGPMGLAALAISRILRIPCHGTYHSAFPDYVLTLTGDTSMEDACKKYMYWFYNQLDTVYAPSQATAGELEELGVDSERITVYPRGVDTDIFHPAQKNGFYAKWLQSDILKMVYVGRVSREKNLHILAQAFAMACKKVQNCCLVIVGDGPFLSDMQAMTKGLSVIYTGVLDKQELAQAYANADMFVFPSATDTFGNVVLEAQASGLPVIVTDKGGPRENMIPEKTGLVCTAGDPTELCQAMVTLANDPHLLKTMGDQAREYIRTRDFDAAFLDMWEMFKKGVRGSAA